MLKSKLFSVVHIVLKFHWDKKIEKIVRYVLEFKSKFDYNCLIN